MRSVMAIVLAGAFSAACVQLFGGDDAPVFGPEDASSRDAGYRDLGGEYRPDAQQGDAGSDPRDCSSAAPNRVGCWDFENESAGAAPSLLAWDSASVPGLGVVVSPGNASSFAFLSKINAANRHSYLRRYYPMTPFQRMRFGFELLERGCATEHDLVLAVISYGQTQIQLNIGSAGDLLAEIYDPSRDEIHVIGKPLNDWSAVVFDISPSDIEVSVGALRSGRLPLVYTNPSARPFSPQVGQATFDNVATAADCEATYDNVWFEITPPK